MTKSLLKTLEKAIYERSNDYTRLEKEYSQNTGQSLLLDPFAAPQHNLSKSPLSVSVVIPAYNVRESILACLTSIEQSSFNLTHQDRLQVIVVDDGSTDGTWEIIEKSNFSMNFTVVKQAHHGQSQALNTGISVAEGDVIISCDADMVLSYYTIDQFVVRHQHTQNVLLTGFRSNVSKTDPRVNHSFLKENGSHRYSYFTKDERIIYPVPGWPNSMCLASNHYKRLGYGRGLWMPDDESCEDPWLLSDLVIGALFSLSREVFLNIGGYDERLDGWGCADGLLAAQAISNNQYIIPVYAASGLHISHPFRTKNKQKEYSQNRKKFFEIIKTEKISYHPNWIKLAKNRIIKSFVKNPTPTSFIESKKESSKPEKDLFSWNEVDSLLAIGEYTKASISLSNHLIKDNTPERLLRLGKIFLGMKYYQKAINILKDTPIESTIELLTAYAALGKFKLAHATLEKTFKIHPQSPVPSYWHLSSVEQHIKQGEKYLNQGFYDIATRCFEAALIMEPNNKTALKSRDRCMIKL